MVTVQITAQRFENYSDTNTPHWKAKGGIKFSVEVEVNDIMYVDDLKSILCKLVENESTCHERFEYIGHEVIFHKPVIIPTNALMDLIKEDELDGELLCGVCNGPADICDGC